MNVIEGMKRFMGSWKDWIFSNINILKRPYKLILWIEIKGYYLSSYIFANK